MAEPSSPLGLILAGGLARRMGGGDKARIRIGGKTILDRVLATMTPQCARLIINANGDPARFADTGLPVVADSVPGFRRAARRHPRRARLGGGACARHRRRRERAGRLPVPAVRSGGAACRRARAGKGRRSPARARATGGIRWWDLWPVKLREDLRQALMVEGLHKIEIWTARHGIAIADWPDSAGRSVLQRQHARGCGGRGACRGARTRRLDF